jgi:hypothetical protein
LVSNMNNDTRPFGKQQIDWHAAGGIVVRFCDAVPAATNEVAAGLLGN